MNRVDDSYYTLEEPRNPSPVVVNVPHAGEEFPPEIADSLTLDPRLLLRDVDLAVHRLCARAPALGAALLWTRVSRFVVDLNRHPGDCHHSAQRPGCERPSISYGSRGLFWTETTRGETVLVDKLTPAQVEARMAYYWPYHQKLNQLLEKRRQRFGVAMLIDAHSMPSRGASGHADSGAERPDIVLGDNLGRACDAFVIDPIEDVFRRAGYTVSRNQPYRGGYNTQHYGRPRAGMQALQIEINRRLYMDEERTCYQPQRAQAVKRVMERAIETAVGLETPV